MSTDLAAAGEAISAPAAGDNTMYNWVLFYDDQWSSLGALHLPRGIAKRSVGTGLALWITSRQAEHKDDTWVYDRHNRGPKTMLRSLHRISQC